MKWYRWLSSPAVLVLLIAGCAQQPLPSGAQPNSTIAAAVSSGPIDEKQMARQVDSTLSRQLGTGNDPLAAEAKLQLDVGIVSFFQPATLADLPNEQVQREIRYPLVRKAESRFLPYLLRQTLNRQSEQLGSRSPWGVIRVLPAPHVLAHLQVEGEILQSDGERLQLRIRASDSSQRLWLDKQYEHTVKAGAYQLDGSVPVDFARDPYQPLFDRIAEDLLAARSQLTPARIQSLHQLTRLRYAETLAPDAFNGFYQQTASGELQLVRLPAHNDAMLQRVEKVRQYEYFFIDHADQQYGDLFRQMQETYWRWRQYGRELALYIRDYRAREEGQGSGYRRGSLASMNEVYGDYEWFRMQQSNLRELATGFNNEVLPTVLKLDDGMMQLTGDMDAQYGQWQSILQEIFLLEQGDN